MAAANIPIESLVDEPLNDKHYPNRIFEDRSGKFDEFTGAFVIYGLNHEKKTPKLQSVHDYVCDAIWDMGFDAKPDFFSSVSRLSLMKNAPLVCELKKMHLKLGNEILESLEDISRIHPELLLPSKEVVISKFLPPPPQFMVNFSKKLTRSQNGQQLITDTCKALGIEISEGKVSFAEVVMEKYNSVVCQFSDVNIAKKFYNFREMAGPLSKCGVSSISFYRDHQDFYYDKMLLISGLNTKRRDCLPMFLEVCADLGVDITEDEVARCEWLYSKAFKSKAQRSPLVVELTSEEKRVALFQASPDEAKVKDELRLGSKPRKPRVRREDRRKSPEGEGEEKTEEKEGEKEEEEVKKEVKEEPLDAPAPEAAEGEQPALVYRKIYINPFISLPHSHLYNAARDLARRDRNLTCAPMSFYGRISLKYKEVPRKEGDEHEEVEVEGEEENKASAVEDLSDALKTMSLDGGDTIPISSPFDLWKINRKFKSAALDKFFMYTDPYYADVGFMLEPYEWFSMSRKIEKRLSRRQLENMQS